MSESKEVFALIVIDLTEEQITSNGERWITKKWKGFENISRLASVLPENRVFDCHLHFDKDEMNPLRNLYPNVGIAGTPGSELVSELKSMKSIFVQKKQYSAFFGSELLRLLKAENVTTLILSGIQTDYCIFATALDAFNFGFRVIIVTDCCATMSGPAGQRRGLGDTLRFLGNYGRCVSTENALKAIEACSLSVLGAENEL